MEHIELILAGEKKEEGKAIWLTFVWNWDTVLKRGVKCR